MRKVLLTTRLPEVGKFVKTIDNKGQEIMYRMNEDKAADHFLHFVFLKMADEMPANI